MYNEIMDKKLSILRRLKAIKHYRKSFKIITLKRLKNKYRKLQKHGNKRIIRNRATFIGYY